MYSYGAMKGTDPSKIIPLLTDVDLTLTPLDQTLFPGVPTDLKSHDGFQAAHARFVFSVVVVVRNSLACPLLVTHSMH
jgi:hypothetical protein